MEDRPADDISKQARESSADDDRKPSGNPEIGRPDSDCVTADAEEAGMPQANLPRKSHEQIEADRGQRKDEYERPDPIIIGRWKQEWQQDNDKREPGQRRERARREGAHA